MKKAVILIVDDSKKNIQLLKGQLHSQGYTVAAADNGNAVFDIIDKVLPDLILLDIMMPGMNGFEVCKHLKKDSATKDIPVIFLTGQDDIGSLYKGYEVGAVDYLTKPFSAAELSMRIKTHLKLRDTNKKLEEINKQLKEAVFAKDRFLSIIGHDLRNPMNVLLLGLEMMLSDKYEKKTNNKKYIRSLHQSAKQLYKTFENLLQWAYSQIGKLDFIPELLNLNSIIKNSFDFFQMTATQKGIELSCKVDNDVIVYVDSNAIKTIINNLISNALKFTKNGGKIEITAKRKNPCIEIGVADNGLGISQENIEKLFRIEVNHSTEGTSKEKGTGLGLILCKEFVEKSGGKIWVESKFNEGSNFKFTLPSNPESLSNLNK